MLIPPPWCDAGYLYRLSVTELYTQMVFYPKIQFSMVKQQKKNGRLRGLIAYRILYISLKYLYLIWSLERF